MVTAAGGADGAGDTCSNATVAGARAGKAETGTEMGAKTGTEMGAEGAGQRRLCICGRSGMDARVV